MHALLSASTPQHILTPITFYITCQVITKTRLSPGPTQSGEQGFGPKAQWTYLNSLIWLQTRNQKIIEALHPNLLKVSYEISRFVQVPNINGTTRKYGAIKRAKLWSNHVNHPLMTTLAGQAATSRMHLSTYSQTANREDNRRVDFFFLCPYVCVLTCLCVSCMTQTVNQNRKFYYKT